MKTHFDRQNWQYTAEDDSVLVIALDRQLLRWFASEKSLCVDVFFDDASLAENWSKVTAYVEQANGRLVLGNLRTDSNAGLVWFHHAIGFPPGELTESHIQEIGMDTVLCSKLFGHELSELSST